MPRAFINGVNTCYNIDGSGEPLFLIQGLTGGRNDWFFQMRSFRKHYRVVTFDNRGAGSTDKPEELYDIRTMADDTIGLMDHLKVDKAHILGMSLGSLIAQEIAINYPDRIMKLILVAAIVYGEGMREITEGIRKALGLRENYSEDEARNVMNNIDVKEYFAKVAGLSFNKKLFRMMLTPLSKIHAKRIGLEGLMGQLHAASTCETLDKIHTIEAPTLVLTGAQDKVVSPHSSELIADRIPNAKLVKVEDGSHAFFLEKPRRFNREVLAFLRDS
jgi:pimeloyl-ACP methyl ester carboxylesterase